MPSGVLMKNNSFLTLIFLLQAAALHVQAQTFFWKRSLKPDFSSGWHNFSMPVEMFAKTKPGFADMRIYALGTKGDTTEVPYIIDNTSSAKAIEQKDFTILNKAVRDGRFYYTLQQPGDMSTLNEIELSFAEENFDLKLTLEGSMNQEEWFTLLKDYRVTGIKNSNADFSFTTLSTEFVNYKYYRVHYGGSKDPGITGARYCVSLKTNTGAWWETNPAVLKSENLKKEQQTVCVVELKEPFPASMIQVHIKDSLDFIRPVTISAIPWPDNLTGSNEEKFLPVYSGTLNSFDNQQINFGQQLTKHLKIIITNYDNAPLTIDSIIVKSKKLLVTARVPEAAEYIMMYGNKDLQAPRYDLAEVLAKMEMPEFGSITVGPEERNIPEKPASWWQHNNWLYGLMGFIILMLGWFTLKMMRKETGEIPK